ncbi:DnrO protein [Arenimonas metalli]|nr:DnrO protein [Arenimonas metalli]
MHPTLPHALVALVLALPALVASSAGGEPPVDAQSTQATEHDGAHAAEDAQDGHGNHGHDADADAGLPATRWASDAPLREGMRRVRAATEALSHGAHGHLDEAQVKAVAAELEAAVQDMIARCRLDPEPDAALHPLLASVLRASAALAAEGFDPSVLADLEAVLARYPQLFEDADWSEDHNASA